MFAGCSDRVTDEELRRIAMDRFKWREDRRGKDKPLEKSLLLDMIILIMIFILFYVDFIFCERTVSLQTALDDFPIIII
ncbi:hypothetical protein BpHYR1_022780 [Brachionus plicatilis]|uniref:Uncharacterized protein n=1 Tax=Brachionus plicatilis TaxID=10195 RepID=A0A3M7QKC8_BRAPC|nr:hypothetical protein BpHYR1_022780 [Brachionus plicatilis]